MAGLIDFETGEEYLKILLLGVGMQGKAALHDLMENNEVTEIIAADRDFHALKTYTESRQYQYASKLRCQHFDAASPQTIETLLKKRPDVIIDLLPVSLHDAVSFAAIDHGIHLVNASYLTPAMIKFAKRAPVLNSTILPECGMDPGLDLVLLGQAVKECDTVEKITTYGAGFPEPEAAGNLLKYKVTWNLEGVLKSYVRPASLIKNNTHIDIPGNKLFQSKQVHTINIDGLGTLEAFPNGNALDIIDMLPVTTINLHSLARYVLRWPGHCSFWKKLIDLGFLDDEEIMVDGRAVDRKRYLASLLGPQLQYGPDERDAVVVRVEVTGIKEGKRQQSVFQIIDRRDLETGLTAMSRTVGYTAAISARLVGTGAVSKRGVLSPIRDIPYNVFKQELARKGIQITSQVRPLENRETQ